MDVMSRFKVTAAFALASGLVLLSGCGQAPEPAKADAPSAAPRPASTSKDGEWVLAVRSSGAELPLVLRFDLSQRPVPGQAFPLRLRLESPEDIEVFSLRMQESAGLVPVGALLAVNEPRIPAGGKIEHQLSLKATRAGIFELRFEATLAPQAGKERSAIFSVPVIVSAP